MIDHIRYIGGQPVGVRDPPPIVCFEGQSQAQAWQQQCLPTEPSRWHQLLF